MFNILSSQSLLDNYYSLSVRRVGKVTCPAFLSKHSQVPAIANCSTHICMTVIIVTWNTQSTNDDSTVPCTSWQIVLQQFGNTYWCCLLRWIYNDNMQSTSLVFDICGTCIWTYIWCVDLFLNTCLCYFI